MNVLARPPWALFVVVVALLMATATIGSVVSMCRHFFPSRQRDVTSKDGGSSCAATVTGPTGDQGPASASVSGSSALGNATTASAPAVPTVNRQLDGVSLPTSGQRANLRVGAPTVDAMPVDWLMCPLIDGLQARD